ncbi:ergothioneine biosynthesis protein EgtB [bacterium]|jgi:ergothioneine biosynthesis protein EgtB|nr:ergothioneine biosynthesis protein EgtB [bacterium]
MNPEIVNNISDNTAFQTKKTFDSNTQISKYLICRQNTETICENLEIEDYVVQPSNHISPPKWHLAHTTWFFEEMILKQFKKNYQVFNKRFSKLFNSYYKASGEHWLQSERGNLSRPTVKEIYAYRTYIDEKMTQILKTIPENTELNFLITTGIQHEEQHQELLYMDIKAILAANPELPIYYQNALAASKPNKQQWVNFKEGIYKIGHSSEDFSYDNETPQHKCYLRPFSISTKTITNGEYLKFITENAYTSPTYWLSLGWEWVITNKISSPLYWTKQDDKWFEFTLHGLIPLDLESPVVHINYFEANAYASWSGNRLPTEQELEIFLSSHSKTDKYEVCKDPTSKTIESTKSFESPLKSSIDLNKKTQLANLNKPQLHPLDSIKKTYQVWCWTQSHYSPYPGFKQFDGKLKEYNGKFMCNQFVLKGGCIATPKNHLRDTYRNFYQPDQRWMFSGIRLAKDIS